MKIMRVVTVCCGIVLLSACVSYGEPAWRSMPEVLDASSATDWRDINPANVLLMQLDTGVVTMELTPQFAPDHVDNLRKLTTAGHFNQARIVRSQDNYVVQWSSDGPIGEAAERLAGEFYRDASGLDFKQLDSRDAYASEVGFVGGFPVGRDSKNGRAWLTHCYRMLGVGRDLDSDSGNGAELYVVTGHAPRHLDRNVTLIGRVIDGIDHLTTLPRGTGPLGFFADKSAQLPIRAFRFANDNDPQWQALRTDTDTFDALIRARRHRNEDWFLDPTNAIELCNVPLPIRHK